MFSSKDGLSFYMFMRTRIPVAVTDGMCLSTVSTCASVTLLANPKALCRLMLSTELTFNKFPEGPMLCVVFLQPIQQTATGGRVLVTAHLKLRDTEGPPRTVAGKGSVTVLIPG